MTSSTFPKWEKDSELRIVLDIAQNIKKYYPSVNIFVLSPHHKNSKKKEIINNIKIYRYQYFFEHLEKLHHGDGMLANIKKNKLLLFLLPLSIISQILAIKKIVKKHNINIIHAHWLIPQGFIAVLYKKIFNKNIKIICTLHGSDIFSLQNIILKNLKKYILKNCNLISAVSSTIKKEILKYKISSQKIKIIHNGIDLNFTHITKNKNDLKRQYNISSFCLLFVGRLNEQKGIKYLINALPKVIKKLPKIKLLIIGEGPDKNKIKKQVQKLNLNQNIIFTGKIENQLLPSYYNMADIFIGPSIITKNNSTEGFGMVLLEALINETPVITTNSGGMTDIIENNISGIIVTPKNSGAITNAVLDLLNNHNKRKILSDNGKKLVLDKFNWKKISFEYFSAYQQIL